jgi:hypothetical protein
LGSIGPGGRSQFSNTFDRQDGGEIIVDGDLQSTTGFDDGEDQSDVWTEYTVLC